MQMYAWYVLTFRMHTKLCCHVSCFNTGAHRSATHTAEKKYLIKRRSATQPPLVRVLWAYGGGGHCIALSCCLPTSGSNITALHSQVAPREESSTVFCSSCNSSPEQLSRTCCIINSLLSASELCNISEIQSEVESFYVPSTPKPL